MPLTFRSPAHADVVMLDKDAHTMIRLMGHHGDIPGALDADSVPAALAALESEIKRLEKQAAEEAADAAGEEEEQDDDHEQPVSLQRKAWPLIQMLRAAASEEEHVSWYR